MATSKTSGAVASTRSTVTISDVARALGVHKSTVSVAFTGNGYLAEETRKRILEGAKEMGYHPNELAQRLAGGRNSRLIGLVSLNLDLGISTQKIKSIQNGLSRAGYEAPIYSYGMFDDDSRYQSEMVGALRRQKPRAIVCFTNGEQGEALRELQNAISNGETVVCYDYQCPLACDQVIFDRSDDQYRATNYLQELGHRKIGLYTHGNGLSRARLSGFEIALREKGEMVNPEWLWSGGLYEAAGETLADKFLQAKERPSAICITDDTVAAVFIHRVRQAGVRVPEDLSVVACGDTPLTRFSAVPITTTTHPGEEIATAVVDLLLARLDGKETGPPRHRWIQSELIERASTAPPKV